MLSLRFSCAPRSAWETLRRQIRSLENTLESDIANYAKLCTSVSTAYSSNGKLSDRILSESREVEERIEDNLKQVCQHSRNLSLQVDQIYRLLQTSSVAPTGSMTHACNRHKEVLDEYERDFKRTRVSLRECEQRASLLSSVRSEISSFKSSQVASEEDRHLNDRNSINSSHRLADDVLGQAYETRYQFSNQRRTLFNSNSRMSNVIGLSSHSTLHATSSATVPGVNSLISMINLRRRRDTLILASIAGGCTFILLLLTFR
ncbi:golgi SNAP receptor complex member 1 [Puccinia sorghi]|uniref:Golgi SNAP receptor complex member 1 n=1 Tax=Puccinia sorghi TaxID=27349 RepID=A0A0L6UI62_9BASI|nr:golgi SNAP receptor complex member 1 [Puccinia sorghi]